MLNSKSPPTELKCKILKTKAPQTPTPRNKCQHKKKNKGRTKKEGHDWKGDYIIITEEPKTEKNVKIESEMINY